MFNFLEYLDNQRPTMNWYIFDTPDDYIGKALKQHPVAHHSMTPVYKHNGFTYMNKRTHFLLYFLHKIYVRPPR